MVCLVSVGFDNDASGSMALKLIQLTGKPASKNRETEKGCRKSLGLCSSSTSSICIKQGKSLAFSIKEAELNPVWHYSLAM